MTPRHVLLLASALSGCGLACARAAPDDVVQTPEVVVTGALLPPEASGATRVSLDPATDAPVSPWEGLGRAVANLHVAEGGSAGYGSLFELRGLSNTPYFSDPAVTVYLDDIPLPSSFTYPEALFGFGSASVFRGPQGTEFGRATDGGVIVYGPAPNGDVPAGELISASGSDAARQAAVEARTAAGGAADASFAADFDARSGYIDNRQLGIRVDDQEDENAFARLRVRPAAGDEISLEVLRTRSRDGAQPLVPLSGPLYAVSRAMEGVTDLDSWGAALRATLALPGGATLASVTSCTDWRMNPYQSFLVLPPPLENKVLQDQKSWNEEIRLKSDPAAAARGALGVWLSRGTTDNFVDRAIPGLFPVEVSGFGQAAHSAAVFAEAVLEPGPAWRLTAGLRAEEDDKTFARAEEVPVPGLGYAGEGRYSALLPRLAADWAASADSHAEASVASGMRPGGFASYTDNPALIPFSSERTTALELGWDRALRRHTLDLALRGFYDAITNLQIERSFSATDYMVATAPRAHSLGGEAEARWTPSGSWALSADLGWTDVRLDRFTAPLTGQDESGNEAPNAPHYNAALEAAWRPLKGWFAAGQLSAVGKTHFDELGTAAYSQRAYVLLGLRAGYQAARWTLAAYGENLGKAGYFALIVPGVNSGAPGAPRTVGVKATLRL